jgi:hypothetical protein
MLNSSIKQKRRSYRLLAHLWPRLDDFWLNLKLLRIASASAPAFLLVGLATSI